MSAPSCPCVPHRLIDNMEFIKAMRNRFGCNVTPWVLDEVFRSIDTDGSGEIGFDELFE